MGVAEVKGRHPVGRGAELTFAAQADHQVGADIVGGGRTLGVRGAAVDRTGQKGLHPDGGHPALKSTRQVPQHIRFADRTGRTVHDQAVIRTAAARIDDDALARQLGTRTAHQFFFAKRVGRSAGDP